jgi:PAS domain S-box-containing protein
MLLAALALLPLAGLLFYNAVQQRHEAAAEAEGNAMRLARVCSNNEERMVESTARLLTLMADMPAVKSLDARACRPFFARALGNEAGYANLGVLNTQGAIIASARPVAAGEPFARRGFFLTALAQGKFTVSDFSLDPHDQGAEMMCANVVRTDDGRIAGVVFAELDLGWLVELGSRIGLSPNATISILDGNGTILMRVPSAAGWIGKVAPEAAQERRILNARPFGTAYGQGPDQAEWLYAFTSLDPIDGLHEFVSAGVPDQVALSAARRSEWRQFIMLAIFALLALAAAWLAADILVVRGVRMLLRATQKVTAGDLRVRAGHVRGGGEFRELAAAFDTMASSIEEQNRARDAAEQELEKRVRQRTAELAEANRKLQEQIVERGRIEAEMRVFIANVPAILFSIDRAGVITMAEGSGLDALKASRGDIVGRSVVELYGDVPGVVDSVKRALGGESFTSQMELRQLHFEVSYSPVRSEDGAVTGVTGVAHDITERVRAKEELERTADELRRSNAELEQFAYIASHDLQEPLRMVASYTQLLERRYSAQLDDMAREFIAYAVDGARRMQEFVSGLLRYSRVSTEPQVLEEVNLGEVFLTALANLRIAIEESCATVDSGDLPVVQGDPRQLTQLLQNLIGNALKFRKPGRPPRVKVWAEREGGFWRISVQDNGIGLDPRFSERVFVIFQRLHTRDEYEGTGLGLAICRKIVERHGGRIWVESKEDEGATFSFTLPVAAKVSP